ncbi:hypothetical protein Csa_006488 [Cucumis sativus]|uniref:Uncharacterized protein n=1 Tax=Cucumis sativus TaxID=3659 RepID=A0A0A0LNJ2_CUCSA|nr:hypothetical protein Csa_006488 [Cucumis sativus]
MDIPNRANENGEIEKGWHIGTQRNQKVGEKVGDDDVCVELLVEDDEGKIVNEGVVKWDFIREA